MIVAMPRSSASARADSNPRSMSAFVHTSASMQVSPTTVILDTSETTDAPVDGSMM